MASRSHPGKDIAPHVAEADQRVPEKGRHVRGRGGSRDGCPGGDAKESEVRRRRCGEGGENDRGELETRRNLETEILSILNGGCVRREGNVIGSARQSDQGRIVVIVGKLAIDGLIPDDGRMRASSQKEQESESDRGQDGRASPS